MSEVESEIAEMLKVIDDVPITVIEEVPDDGKEKEEKEEVLEVEPPKEEPKVEEPKDEEEILVVEEKKEDPVVDEKDKVIEELRAKISELSTPVKPTEVKPPVESPKIEDQDFVKDFDMDEVTRDPLEFNKVLNKVYQKASNDVQTRFAAELPGIISHHIAVVQNMEATRRSFYEANKDLEPFGNVVAVVFEELAKANAEKPYGDVIKLVAPEVRKRLKLPEPSVQKGEVKSGPKPPNLPRKDGKAGNLTVAKPNNSTQSEIEEMNKSLGG
jgi:hypothetical protein